MADHPEGETHKFSINSLLNDSAAAKAQSSDAGSNVSATDEHAAFLKLSLMQDFVTSAPAWLAKSVLVDASSGAGKLEGKATLQVCDRSSPGWDSDFS